jgi:hypothetical protein
MIAEKPVSITLRTFENAPPPTWRLFGNRRVLCTSTYPWRVLQNDTEQTTFYARMFGPTFIDRMRYMSESRSRDLYKYHKEIMEALEVPFLDVYRATFVSADWTRMGDGRHYHPDLNKRLLAWFS